jgi:POT family proton-dependent oligopeptide transporter
MGVHRVPAGHDPFILLMVTNTAYTDLFMYIIGPLTLVYLVGRCAPSTAKENKRLGAALVFIFFSVLFWAFFEQSGRLAEPLRAEQPAPYAAGRGPMDPNVVNNSANSLFVIIFAPIGILLWLWLAKRKMLEPNSVVKFGIGFLLLAGAFFALRHHLLRRRRDGITSLDVFTLAYFVITFGELSLSPDRPVAHDQAGADIRIQGLMMGMWFLASAYGQYVAGITGRGHEHGRPQRIEPQQTGGLYQRVQAIGHLCVGAGGGAHSHLPLGAQAHEGGALNLPKRSPVRIRGTTPIFILR